MSVINQMLKDLEQRQQGGEGPSMCHPCASRAGGCCC